MTEPLLNEIAACALDASEPDAAGCDAARFALRDALACAFLALRSPACLRLIGPIVPGATLPGGARVPGTSYELDPPRAAFSFGSLVRWLDCNDTWLAAEWGHPADNLAPLLATGDWLARRARMEGREPPRMRALLGALLRACEIQSVLAPTNPLDHAGLDPVVFVRVASAAVVAAMLGGDLAQVTAALSHAFLDGAPLRAYRHAPNLGTRKGWAAADAASRGLQLALLALGGERGVPAVLSTPGCGFQDALLRGAPLRLARPLGSHARSLGHPARRAEALPLLAAKFESAVTGHFRPKQAQAILALFADPGRLDALPVNEFVAALVTNQPLPG